MGLDEVVSWIRCSKWAKWVFILGGLGGGYFTGGKLNYRGGKRAVVALAGGGTGWLISWLLGRACNGVGNGEMLPEWSEDEYEDEPHLLGPSVMKSPAIRDRMPMPESMKKADAVLKTPKTPPIATRPTSPTQPTLTTSRDALLKKPPVTSSPTVPSAANATSPPTIPGAMGSLGRRRPKRGVTSLLGGGRGKAYGS